MKTLKRGLLLLLALVMVLSCLTVPAMAEGDPNIDGEDGGTGAGSKSAFWTAQLQGVRVSIYDIKGHRVRATADYK